jgi:hypothetical protein
MSESIIFLVIAVALALPGFIVAFMGGTEAETTHEASRGPTVAKYYWLFP